MTEAESYTEKENAKSQLLSALIDYIAASREYGLDDEDQAKEICDVMDEAGKSWDVVSR